MANEPSQRWEGKKIGENEKKKKKKKEEAADEMKNKTRCW